MATEFLQTPVSAQKRSASPGKSLSLSVDLSGVRDKAGFLSKIAGKLDLPHYFGGNWDAAEECVAEWLRANGWSRDVTLNIV